MTLIRTSPSGPNIEVDAPVDLGPNSIYGNPTPAPAPGVDIALGPNTVLGRVAGNIVAAQLVTAQVALNQVTNALLAQGAPLTVKANPTGALADFQDVAAAADDTVFRRVGGVLDFGPLTPGMIPAGIFPLSSIEPIAPNTVVANATAGLASPTAVAVGTNTVLGRVAGNIVAAQVVGSQIGTAEVQNTNLALMDPQSVKVNATGAPASPTDLTIGMNSVLGRVGGNIIAAQLVTAQIALNQVDNTILAQMAANTVKVNATGVLSNPQDLAVGTNTVLGRVAGNIVAAQLVTAQIGSNQVTNATLAQMAALTVKANATNALANAADLAAGSNDTLLRRTGDTLNFGALTPGMIPVAIIPLSAIEQLAANTVVANATAGLASPTAVPLGLNTVLGRVAGNIVAAQLVTSQIALNQVTNAVLAQMAANTVKVNATAALADPQDLSVGTNTVLGRVAGNIVAAQLVDAQITNATISLPKLATQAANTVLANATAGVASPTAVAVGTNTVLGRVAGNIVAAQLVTAQIGTNQVTNATLAQMAALTVKANATNALANAADLAAGSDDTVLRRTASTLSFGQLTAGMFPAAIIPLSSLATQAANTIVANATAGVASPTAVAVGTNTVVGRVAGNIVAAQLVTAQIAVNQVTNAVLAQMAANTVKVNATAALADPQDLAVGTNTVLGRVAGNIVAAQLVTAQIALNQVTNAVLAQMAANTVKVNATAALADPQDLAVGTNTVLGRVAGNIVAAQLVTAQIGTNQVTNATLAQMAALTVKANATNALANAADLAAGSDDTVLRRTASTLSFGQLTAGMFPAAIIPLSSLATQAANTIVANATAGVASPTAVAVGTNTVVGRVAGNIVAAQLVTAQIAVNQVTNAVLAQMAANTVKVNATAALADPQDLAVGTNTVLGRVAGNIVAAQLVNAQFLGGALATVKGVAVTGIAGTLTDLAGADVGGLIRFANAQGDTTSSGTLTTFTLTNQAINNLTFNGNTVTLHSIVAPTASGTFLVLKHIGAGTLTLVQDSTSAPAAVDRFNFGQFAQNSTPIVLGTGQGQESILLIYFGSRWQWVENAFALASILPSFLAAQAANTVLANATAGSASPTAVSVGTNTVLGRVAGNIVAAQLVNAQFLAGAIGTTKGVTIDGVAGVLQDLTGAEQAENFRRATVQTIASASGDITVTLADDTTVLLVESSANVRIQAITHNLAIGSGRELVVEHIRTSGTGELTLQSQAGIVGSSDLLLPNNADVVVGNRASLTLRYRPSFWRQDSGAYGVFGSEQQGLVPVSGGGTTNFLRADSTFSTIGTSSLTPVAANTIIANATAGVASPTAFAVGTNTVVGRIAGNIVAVQVVNAQVVGGTLGTVKGVPLGGVAGTLQDLTQAQQAENLLYSTTVDVNPASGDLDIVITTATTYVRIFPTANCVLRSISATTQGKEIRVLCPSSAFTVTLSNVDPGGTLQLIACPDATSIPFGSNASFTLYQESGTWRLRNHGINVFTSVTPGLTPLSGGGTVNYLRADGSFTTVPVSSLTAVAANTVIANATAGAAAPTAVAVGTNAVLGRVAGNIVAAQLVDAQITNATISLPKLATQAPNTILANATAGVASPSAFAIGTNTVLGRIAGNIVANQVVNAQVTGGSLGTAKGVSLGGVAGTLQDLTQAQQAENLLYATTVDVVGASGNLDIAITTATTYVRIFPTANCVLRSLTSTAQGKEIRVLCIASAFTVTLSNNDAGGTLALLSLPASTNIAIGSNTSVTLYQESGTYRLRNHGINVFTSTTPGLTPLSGGGIVNYLRADGSFTTVPVSSITAVAANTVVANATAGAAAPTAVAVGTNTVLGRVAGNIVAAALVPAQLAIEAASIAVTFSIRVTMTATGAAADDVVIYNANAPFAFRILKTFPVVTALVAAATFVGRNATAGGGATVTSTFSANVVSDDPAITANNGVSLTIAAGGTLVIRRSSGNIAGEVVLLCCRS